MTLTSTISDVLWPRPALAGCIRGIIVRDTRGCALDQIQRFTFFPASLFPCVIWMFAGASQMIDGPDQMDRPWTGSRRPRFAFLGTLPRPTISWNAGEIYSIGISFFPYALSAMTGLDLSSFAGRIVPAEEALPQPMLEACRHFFDAIPHEGLERSFSVLQNEIEIMWAGIHPARTKSLRLTADWSRSLVHSATATGSGCSGRQIARRVKSWTGVGQRDLQVFAHMEQLDLKIREAGRKGDLDWAALAAASGFCDQAHMIRRMRLFTGLTPTQLHESESARYDEAFWYYRLRGRIIDQFLARPKGQ
jgi:AraC-like DNA-binding protein